MIPGLGLGLLYAGGARMLPLLFAAWVVETIYAKESVLASCYLAFSLLGTFMVLLKKPEIKATSRVLDKLESAESSIASATTRAEEKVETQGDDTRFALGTLEAKARDAERRLKEKLQREDNAYWSSEKADEQFEAASSGKAGINADFSFGLSDHDQGARISANSSSAPEPVTVPGYGAHSDAGSLLTASIASVVDAARAANPDASSDGATIASILHGKESGPLPAAAAAPAMEEMEDTKELEILKSLRGPSSIDALVAAADMASFQKSNTAAYSAFPSKVGGSSGDSLTPVTDSHTDFSSATDFSVPTVESQTAASEASVPTVESQIAASEASVPTVESQLPSYISSVPSVESQLISSASIVPPVEAQTPDERIDVPSIAAEMPTATDFPTVSTPGISVPGLDPSVFSFGTSAAPPMVPSGSDSASSSLSTATGTAGSATATAGAPAVAAAKVCPKCSTPRMENFSFCLNCLYNFDAGM